MRKSKILKLRLRALYIGLIGIFVLWISSGLGGNREGSQTVSAIGGLMSIIGIVFIVDALVTRYSKKQ